jgi:hypothetical protein
MLLVVKLFVRLVNRPVYSIYSLSSADFLY